MDFEDGLFELVFTFIFIAMFLVIIVAIIQGIAQWNKNNNSPRLTVAASIVSKRQYTSHHHHSDANGMGHSSTSTSYYVTFQVESGDHMELHVPSNEYGMLVEGDRGQLTFQGTRYLGFQREY